MILPRASLGIDPGVSGGIAVIRPDGVVGFLRGFTPGMLEEDLVAAVKQAISELQVSDPGRGAVFIEKVGYRPTDGGQGAFTFGSVFGLLRGAVLMAGYRPRYVYPQAWQARMDCLTGGVKNVSKAAAAKLFPKERITHAVADALLIAEYGRRVLAGRAAAT